MTDDQPSLDSANYSPSRRGKLSYEERERLVELYRDDEKIDSIASILNVSPGAVVYHARRAGLRRKNRKARRAVHAVALRVCFDEKVTLARALDEVQCALERAGIRYTCLGTPGGASWTRRAPQPCQRAAGASAEPRTARAGLPLGIAQRGSTC